MRRSTRPSRMTEKKRETQRQEEMHQERRLQRQRHLRAVEAERHRANPQEIPSEGPHETQLTDDPRCRSWAQKFNARRRQPHRLHWSNRCVHCSCLLLNTETPGWCCNGGRWHVPALPPLPAEWEMLFRTYPLQLGQTSRALNNLFAMTAMGVSGGFLYPSGLSNVIISGRTYHRLLDLQSGQHPLRWYLYDEQGLRLNFQNQGLPAAIVDQIRQGLIRVNPYLRHLRETCDLANGQPFHLTLDAPVAPGEVAALINVTNMQSIGPRMVTFFSRHDDRHQYISILSPHYEPLQYPLLFPHGTTGWAPSSQPRLTQIQWYRSRILTEDRFLRWTRLAQEYMVDMYSRVEDERINFIREGRRRQQEQQQQWQQGDADPIEDHPWQSALPSSFMGSRAWSSNQVADALALCRQFGRPTLFLTMTTNPQWPEIVQRLQPGQTAADVPSIVVRVFHEKMAYLIRMLEQACGGFAYIVHVVEFQKRGLPHCHMLIRLTSELTSSVMDDLVSAELPSEEVDPSLREIILRCNIHPRTHLKNPSSRCNRNGRCIYNFPQPIQERTTVDEFGRVHLRRRHVEDQWVVSYIPALSRALQCHIHVDICSNVAVVMYLYKYLFKGVDQAQAHLTQQDDPAETDEFKEYVNCRYLSSSEAMWRILGYHITRKTPAVTALGFHLPDRQQRRMNEKSGDACKSATSLLYYFARPRDPHFDGIKYADYHAEYQRCKSAPTSDPGHLRTTWREVQIPGTQIEPQYIIRRSRVRQVMRLKIIAPQAGELYYLRSLLRVRAARSFEELRLIDGHLHPTFQEAAMALGLFKHERESEQVFEEAVTNCYAPAQLRFLLAQLLIDLPTPFQQLWDRHRDLLSLDFMSREKSPSRRALLALQDLQRHLQARGARLAQFGITEPQHPQSELDWEREQMLLERDQIQQQYDHASAQFTEEQRSVFDLLQSSIDQPQSKAIFIDGRAGRGKSFVLQAFVNYCRLRGIVLAIVGSTALSVSGYARGRTAHSAFGIPVNQVSWNWGGGGPRAAPYMSLGITS
jgi:Helitron helicase-like domain at N-terminus/PIF1-like helicase